MNPFAQFAYGAKLSEKEGGDEKEVRCVVEDPQDQNTSSMSRKRENENEEHGSPCQQTVAPKKKKKVSKSNPDIMAEYWISLKELTSNYPFAVLLTGVLGAQTRDIVTVGVMKELAESLGGDICPLNICSRTFDELENSIKRLNYCHKKTQSMMNLAAIFRAEPVPSTLHGLKTIPGVGPVISEIILRVAFGAEKEEVNTEKRNVSNKEFNDDNKSYDSFIVNEVNQGTSEHKEGLHS